MACEKRKAQCAVDKLQRKRPRQKPPSPNRLHSVLGQQQRKYGKRPHTQENIQEQYQFVQSWQPMFNIFQEQTSPQISGQQKFEASEVEPQELTHIDEVSVQQSSCRKREPLMPYTDLTLPILWSAEIDHHLNLALKKEDWDSTAWKAFYGAIVMLKNGINRKILGLPEVKEGHGKPISIDCVDLYLNLSNNQVYVAASERGLITVVEYLKLCDVALERKIRFVGKTPGWAKALFGAAEKRYVTELFDELPLRVRSEVQVFKQFQVSAPRAPAGTWAYMYSAQLKKVIQFPLAYTSNNRDFSMAKTEKGLPLSEAEVKHVLALSEKQPSPQELGEALFKQAQDCDQHTLDLDMSKSRDDHLQEVGHGYGRYAPANTQKKEGVFFNSPPYVPYDEGNDDFVVYERKKGLFYVEWKPGRSQSGPATQNTKPGAANVSKVQDPTEPQASLQSELKKPANERCSAETKKITDVNISQKVKTDAAPLDIDKISSRKRERTPIPMTPIKWAKTGGIKACDGASTSPPTDTSIKKRVSIQTESVPESGNKTHNGSTTDSTVGPSTQSDNNAVTPSNT